MYHFSDSVNPTCLMGIKESWEADFLKGYCLYPNLSRVRKRRYSIADISKGHLNMESYTPDLNDKSYLTTFGAIPYCFVMCGLLCFIPIAASYVFLSKDAEHILEMRHMQHPSSHKEMEDRDLKIVNDMLQSLAHLKKGGGHLFFHRLLVDLTYPIIMGFQTFIFMLAIGRDFVFYGYYVFLEKLIRNPLVSRPKFNLDTMNEDITGELFPTGEEITFEKLCIKII